MKKKFFYFVMSLIVLLTFTPVEARASSSFVPNKDNLVPAMTGYDTPSGKVTASRDHDEGSRNCLAWEAFDHLNNDHYNGEWVALNFNPAKPDWIAYEFEKQTVINQYSITSAHYTHGNLNAPQRAPKKWIFQGSNDGQSWTDLDTQTESINWKDNETREFSFNNQEAYKVYRLYILEVNGKEHLAIGEIEMMNRQTDPGPDPEPEQPVANRAILVITMNTGLEKEFDLSMLEVNDFISWFEHKQAGSGTASYAINKHNNNKGPFSARKDYVIFDKILTFEVSEYSTATSATYN